MVSFEKFELFSVFFPKNFYSDRLSIRFASAKNFIKSANSATDRSLLSGPRLSLVHRHLRLQCRPRVKATADLIFDGYQMSGFQH
jgi:hypothetical protein